MYLRLSSMAAAVRAWLLSKREVEQRYCQALAECRALKRELKDADRKYRLDTETYAQVADDNSDVIESLKRELADCRSEIRDKDWQIREHESMIILRDKEIEDMSLMIGRLRVQHEKAIALDQQAIARGQRVPSTDDI